MNAEEWQLKNWDRGVVCTSCKRNFIHGQMVNSSNKYQCPYCLDNSACLFDDDYDNKPASGIAERGKPITGIEQQSVLDQAIAAGAPIDRTAKPKKDMRVPSFEEKEADRERLRVAVAKEMGWA